MNLTSLIHSILLSSSLADIFSVGNAGAALDTTSGTVRGKASTLRPGVSEYLGIPYAKAPKGDLRFAAPQPADTSSTVLEATSYGPACPQAHSSQQHESPGGPVANKLMRSASPANPTFDEDCLTINVWTKPHQGEKKKAVLFWIHGGGFQTGSGTLPLTDGSVLADENDVIVVSFNYRLNIFGFPGAPGQPWNVGLLDQRLALEWTRDNIAQFGGDPSRITVFGQSAGGASADFLTYSYPEDPIAHAVIAQSGDANAQPYQAKTAELQKKWYNASSALGCGDTDAGQETVSCMRSKTPDELLALVEKDDGEGLENKFIPAQDGVVLPRDILKAGSAGKFARIPFMTGTTDKEGDLFMFLAMADTNATSKRANVIPMDLVRPISDILTLTTFTCPAAEAAKYRSDHNVPVWRYRYYGGNYSNTYFAPFGSAYHASELPLLFGTAATVTGVEDSEYEAKAAAYMRNAWATFAKHPATGLDSEFHWPRFSPQTKSEVQLSLHEQTQASFISNAETDALCPIAGLAEGLIEVVSKLFSHIATDGETSQLGGRFHDTLKSPFTDASSVENAIDSLRGTASHL
ncbi:cholinesterase [Aspergillus ambiguus]|uniref:carboxylesterase/lipase family protein n=1 Tax=Aspergillus ambiguus TaxID=176160 RepID=UPI003CCDF9DA